jgi:hypothetical protein
MRRLSLALAVAVALVTAAPARAHGPDIVPAPGAAELAGRGWDRIVEGRNDAFDHQCVPLVPGLVQPYSSDGAAVDCVIPAGSRLFIQFGAYAATWEGFTTASEQRRKALALNREVRSLRLSARGQTVELDRHRFAYVTRQRRVWVDGPQTFTAAGHAAIISGLRSGDTVTLDIVAEQFTFTFTLHVR